MLANHLYVCLLAAGGYTIAPPPEHQKVSAKASKNSAAAAAAGEDEEEDEADPAAGCCNPSDTESDDDADRMAAEAAARAAGHRPNPSYVTQKVSSTPAVVCLEAQQHPAACEASHSTQGYTADRQSLQHSLALCMAPFCWVWNGVMQA